MSLKLGNTNIAGTQVLYSTTGNNTDGAMTQKATTTELNNCVHKTDDEIIDGFKAITSPLIRKMLDLDVTTAPLSDQYMDWVSPVDKNMVSAGYFGTSYFVDETLNSRLGITRYVNGQPIYQEIRVGIRKDGTISTYAPPSDAINSIVTTVAKSKSENGYFKLGNGLIIQFGLVKNMSNNKAWVNFPIPFTAVPQVVTTSDKNGIADGYNSYVSDVSITGFNAFNKEYGTSVNCWVHWIAIGY